MATIRDVALAAGVSIQTVSNVLNGKTFVRPETMKRVREEMSRLNYRPSRVAQGMRRQLSQTLGLLLSDPNPRGLADPFYGEVLAGMVAVAQTHDYGVRIEWLRSDEPLSTADILAPFQTHRVDAALIFLHEQASGPELLLRELQQVRALFAVLERDLSGDGIYSVLAANFEGAYTATERFIAAGHRRVAFFDSLQRWPSITERAHGYAAAMQTYGLDAHVRVFTSPDWTAEGGGKAAAQMLALDPSVWPTAVLAGSDLLAVGLMQAIKGHRLRVPDDIAVIGFDDFEFARYVDPPLTTVRLPVYEMGSHAATLLLNHLQGGPPAPRRQVLPTELIVRQSG